MIIDPIADMLTRLRNAIQNQEETVEMPASKHKEAILKVMKQEKLITEFKKKNTDKKPVLVVELKYNDSTPAIRHLERVSRPGLRTYSQARNIPTVLSGVGLVIMSTPSGIMTGREAKRKGVGGEIICRIW